MIIHNYVEFLSTLTLFKFLYARDNIYIYKGEWFGGSLIQ